MEFKTVLVDLTEDEARENRLNAALTLASWFDGRVVAVTATGPLLDPYRSAGEETLRYQAMRADLIRQLDAAGTEALVHAVSRFGSKIDTSHRVIEQEAGWALANDGLTSDIILPALPGASTALSPLLASAAEYAMVNSGKPILVVPPAATIAFAGTVLVAWNGRREAARAVADAMPMLRRAARVVVQVVVGRGSASEHGGSALIRWLASHGVQASLQLDESSSIAECLLKAVFLEEASLLVAGGYGHSRIGEMLMGGTTRTLIRNTPVPLLMSH